jgi:hypothetical protein
MDPRNSIFMGFWILLIGLYCGKLAIRLIIQKKEVLPLTAQVIIFINKLLKNYKEMNIIREREKISPNNKKYVMNILFMGIFFSITGFVYIIDGIVTILKLGRG